MDRESCATLVGVMPVFLLAITVQVDRVRRVRIQWMRHRAALAPYASPGFSVPWRWARLGWVALYVVPVIILVVATTSETLLLAAVADGNGISRAGGVLVLSGLISSLILVVIGMLAEWLVVGRFVNGDIE